MLPAVADPVWPCTRRARRGARGATCCSAASPLEQLRERHSAWCAHTRASWDAWRAGARDHVSLAGRACRCAAVGLAMGVPAGVSADARHDAALLSRTLVANMFYQGSLQRADADLSFHSDGLVLLWRDARRWGHLLWVRDLSQLSDRELAKRDQLLADMRALLPFSFIVANAFPVTPGVLRAALEDKNAWLRWLRPAVLPSAWEEARLQLVQKARQRRDRQQLGERR